MSRLATRLGVACNWKEKLTDTIGRFCLEIAAIESVRIQGNRRLAVLASYTVPHDRSNARSDTADEELHCYRAAIWPLVPLPSYFRPVELQRPGRFPRDPEGTVASSNLVRQEGVSARDASRNRFQPAASPGASGSAALRQPTVGKSPVRPRRRRARSEARIEVPVGGRAWT